MTYKLEFGRTALKEWKALSEEVRGRFKSKLKERLENPHIPSARLSGPLRNHYKIKLNRPPYRLVYEVIEDRLVVSVVVVAKRENDLVYMRAAKLTSSAKPTKKKRR